MQREKKSVRSAEMIKGTENERRIETPLGKEEFKKLVGTQGRR